jgi:hypothetical protein
MVALVDCVCRPSRHYPVTAMPYQVTKHIDTLVRYAGQLDHQDWVMISVLVLMLGLITMRGFGSRNSY